MRRIFALAAAAGFLTLPHLTQAAQPELVANGNMVTAIGDGGIKLWTRKVDETLPLQIERRGDGVFAVNGRIYLKPTGQLMQAPDQKSAALTPSESDIWTSSTPAVPGTTSLFYDPQVTDKQGNVWTVIDDAGAQKARIAKFSQKNKVWKTVKTLPEIFAAGQLDVDPLGNVTVVALQITVDADGVYQNYELLAIRYEPDAGWSDVSTIYTEPYSNLGILNVGVAGDKNGNAVVVLDNEKQSALSIAFSAAAQSWQPPQQIKLPKGYLGGMVYGICLARSPNWKYLELAYMAPIPISADKYQVTYFDHTWDAKKLAFGGAQTVPSAGVLPIIDSLYGQNTGDRIPMLVDNSATVSVLFTADSGIKPKTRQGTYAAQRVGGVWGTPAHVSTLPYSLSSDFSGRAVDSSGRVAVTTFGYDYSTSNEIFVVIKFLPGQGWSIDNVDKWYGSTITRSRVAWMGSGQAVGVYLYARDEQNPGDGLYQIQSATFDGTKWQTPIAIPPGNIISFSQSLAAKEGSNLNLLFNPTTADSVVSTVTSTFYMGVP